MRIGNLEFGILDFAAIALAWWAFKNGHSGLGWTVVVIEVAGAVLMLSRQQNERVPGV